MRDYYLRIEGVNLDNFVYDTGDLSTIRGGSLLLLKAPEWLKKDSQAGKGIQLEPITQGASWGLFNFEAEDDPGAAIIATKVREELSLNSDYQHATIMVDVLPAPSQDQYPARREELTALARWRQMSSLSLAIPALVPEKAIPEVKKKNSPQKTQKIEVCKLDHVRPAAAVETKTKDGEEFAVSVSVKARRTYGKDNKRNQWYQARTQVELEGFDFAQDFDELTRITGNSKFAHLNHKMAVIYLDGNHFGSRQHSHCTSETKQKQFDQKIRKEYQDGTLGFLLEKIKADETWLCRQKDKKTKIRLETLLWGGDEVIWVAPAWKGWWLLGRFFEQVKTKWKFFDGTDLTLAAGLVFCHHNAPIQRIITLAKELGELAKGDRSANRVAYQVLESFDHAGVDLAGFRTLRCPEGVKSEELILSGNSMAGIEEAVAPLKQAIPKRRLHRYVDNLYSGLDRTSALADFKKEIGPGNQDAYKLLQTCFGPPPACWLHLLELWDYLPDHVETQNT